METVLAPPPPFCYDQSILNLTSGSLSDSWNKWSKGFKIYYNACELSKKSPEIQLNILLHIVGEQCRELYEHLAVKGKTVDEVLTAFQNHFEQKKNLTVERHRFFTRNQADGETIEQYAYDLKKLSSSCEFGDLCDSLIKDRLVCGVASKAIRERLLREEDLTLTKALEICRAAIVSKIYSDKIIQESRERSICNIITQEGNHESEDNKDIWEVSQRGGWWRSGVRGRGRYASAASRGGRAGWRGAGAARSGTSSGWRAREPAATTRMMARGASGSGRGGSSGAYNSHPACKQCGTIHREKFCPAYGRRCLNCSRMNHFSRMCGVYQIEESDEQVIYSLNSDIIDEWSINLQINNSQLCFKIDTGADVNVLPRRYLSQVGLNIENLLATKTRLHGYSGTKIKVLGKCYIKVQYKDDTFFLEFKVADVTSSPILGRYACKEMNLIKRVFAIGEPINGEPPCVAEYQDVFQGLGCLPGTYKIRLNQGCKPVVHAPRKVPIPLKEKVKYKLEDMERQGIIAKVEGPTDWVNSMTIVKKPNGDLRICLDPKELNSAIRREHFRLPTLDEIVSNLSGAQYFSTLDATNGFWQVKIENSDLCTFNTPFGRYKFLRMPYGISSACEIFHRKIYENFDDIEGVCMYVDDILIYANSKSEHDKRLRRVLERCRKINLKLNLSKCKFGLEEIKYLGHRITRNGLYPDESHVSAIVNMPKPKNCKDVERLLGLTTYVGNFIPNLSEKTKPLRELLKKEIEWHWTDLHENAWNLIKRCLSQRPVLQYYSMSKPITLSVDASKSGLGAVLLQNGLPVCYASKALTNTEQRYAQIEKELYACVFACEKFYGYVYGRTDITIETDHKPLISIIKKPIVDAPPRLQRMLLRLQPYTFKLVYKPGKQLHIADALSRAYESPDAAAAAAGPAVARAPYDLHDEMTEAVRTIMTHNELTDVHYQNLQKETEQDSELQQLKKYIRRGWPENKKDVHDSIKPYFQYREDLTEANGLLWKGHRIIIPRKLRCEMLHKIHYAHLGLEKCLLRARELLFWPEINNQLKNFISNCQACLTFRKNNSKEKLIPHDVPKRQWSKVGIDLFHCYQKNFLLVVDYYSKFIEVRELHNTLSHEIIKELKCIFSSHGIPETVMSDGGPQFTSREFSQFAKKWCFNHVRSSPHYAQSNGQSERSIQVLKNIIKKCVHSNTDFRLALLEYVNSPISELLPSPAELLQNRKLRSILPLRETLIGTTDNKKVRQELINRQNKYKVYYDRHAKNLSYLNVGQKVKVRHDNKSTWVSGTINKVLRDRSYEILMHNGSKLVRNRRHIIVDSPQRPDPDESVFEFDDIQPSPVSTPLASAPVPLNDNLARTRTDHYVTRSGRTVIPPSRWGNWELKK